MPSGQEGPGGQRPGPHPACPGGVDAPIDQSRDRKGETDGEADITEIEQRRMDREAEILKNRIEVRPSAGAGSRREEWIGGQQHEQQEGDRDPALDGQHIGLQRRRQIAAED